MRETDVAIGRETCSIRSIRMVLKPQEVFPSVRESDKVEDLTLARVSSAPRSSVISISSAKCLLLSNTSCNPLFHGAKAKAKEQVPRVQDQ